MVTCIKYKSFVKGSLLGFVSFYVDKWGVEINGCTLNQKDGKRWINFPSKEFEVEGEKKYQPLIKFKDKAHMDIFSEMAKKSIDEYCSKMEHNDQ